MKNDISFYLAPDLEILGLPVACFVMTGVKNRENDMGFDMVLEQVLAEVKDYYSSIDYKTDAVLKGFRELHRRAECGNNRTIAAPENLLRLFLKTGRFPRINLLVDLYNLMSIKTRLALGAHDSKKITGSVHLRKTTGNEVFQALGEEEAKVWKAGEYAYIDDSNNILCRLEIRQGYKSQVTLDTSECLYIVQGNPSTSPEYVWKAAGELIGLIKDFCGGSERILFQPNLKDSLR